jgi:ribonuclease VapC
VIVVDTSALIAIVKGEPLGSACLAAIRTDGDAIISAATVAEALIVGAGFSSITQVEFLLDELPLTVEPFIPTSSRRIGRIYETWGKGFHRANLNFGDCFAYELADRHRCPLLYVGNDFAQTDITSAL